MKRLLIVDGRSSLDSDYKANRADYSKTPQADNPFSQLPDIYSALDYLGVKHAETVTCETDDWITGDTADNIRGAERVGPKTAALLLNEFGTLENILANAEKIRKPSVKASVIQNTEKLKTNYKLIRLGSTAPLPFALHELEYNYNTITTKEILKEIGLL